jgi:hypothetical protein
MSRSRFVLPGRARPDWISGYEMHTATPSRSSLWYD